MRRLRWSGWHPLPAPRCAKLGSVNFTNDGGHPPQQWRSHAHFIVLRPRSRSSSRPRSSSLRTSETPTTGLFDPAATAPPSSISQRHRNRRFVATPLRYRGDGLFRRQSLLDDAQLLLGEPAAAAREAGDHLSSRRISSLYSNMSSSTGLSLSCSCLAVRSNRGSSAPFPAIHRPRFADTLSTRSCKRRKRPVGRCACS